MTVAQLVFHGRRRFITVLTRTHHWTTFWFPWTQSTTLHSVFETSFQHHPLIWTKVTHVVSSLTRQETCFCYHEFHPLALHDSELIIKHWHLHLLGLFGWRIAVLRMTTQHTLTQTYPCIEPASNPYFSDPHTDVNKKEMGEELR